MNEQDRRDRKREYMREYYARNREAYRRRSQAQNTRRAVAARTAPLTARQLPTNETHEYRCWRALDQAAALQQIRHHVARIERGDVLTDWVADERADLLAVNGDFGALP